MAGLKRERSAGAEPGGDDLAGRLIGAIETGLVVVLLLMLFLMGLVLQLAGHIDSLQAGWAEEAMPSVLLWLVMVGSVVAAGRLQHVRVRLTESLVPLPVAMAFRRLAFLAAALVSLVLAWHGLRAVLLEYEFAQLAFGQVPVWMVHAIVPAGFVFMGARFLAFALLPPPMADTRHDEDQNT